MTWYQLFLYLHVAGAIVWVGGATTMQLFGLRARTRGPEALAAFGSDVAWIGKRVLQPALLTVLGAGIAMVLESPWSFSDDWITIALVLFATAYATVKFLIAPASAGLAQALAAGDRDAATRFGTRLAVSSRVELAVLFLIVFDMALKPSFADHGIVAYGLGGFAAAALAILWRGRPERVGRAIAFPDPA
jgi:uncharacterized membrane protein